MTMPDLFEQLDSPAENGDDWIRRLLSEPDETPSPTPAAGDDGTDTGHEPDLPQEEERIVPPQASGPGAGGDVTAPPPSGAHAIPLPASDDTSPSDDLDDMHQDAIPGFGTDMDADEPARAGHAVRIVLTVLAVVAAVALVGVIAAGAVTASARHGAEQAQAVLRETNTIATRFVKAHKASDLADAKAWSRLDRRISDNARILDEPAARLSIRDAGSLKNRAGKANKDTNTLVSAARRALAIKQEADARESLAKAVGEATKLRDGAKRDDDTGTAIDDLTTILERAAEPGKDVTVKELEDLASRVEQARKTLEQAIATQAEHAKAKRAAEEKAARERQERERQAEQQTVPDPTPPQQQQQWIPQYQSGQSGQSDGTGSQPGNGWSVPSPQRRQRPARQRSGTIAHHPFERSTIMTDETPRKDEHRERQGLLGRARDRFERMEPKRQALLLAVAAVIALAATIALNPFQSTTSDQPEPQSAQQATDGGKDTKNQSRTDPSSEPSGFTGSTEDIANKARSILNSPDGGNIDTFGQTLIRHGDKDLGNATDLFDAIGRQEKESTVRALADEWYAEALPKAAGYRLDDLKSSLPKAEHAVDRLPDPTPDDCTGLAKAAKQARTLVDAGSDDYDKLTSAQQTLTKSISACTANMTVDQIDRLFPQDGPSVTIPDTGKEAQ